jgi:hypothetical protein
MQTLFDSCFINQATNEDSDDITSTTPTEATTSYPCTLLNSTWPEATMRSTTRYRSTRASQAALLSVVLLLLLCCKPVPAVNWGQWFSGFGHAVKDAALDTADPRLWDIMDSGAAATPSPQPSNSPSGHTHDPHAPNSLQDTARQPQQQQLAAGLQAATAANPTSAAQALNEAFAHAQQLIDQALTAVLDQRMPGPAEEGFKQALEAFLQAQIHLRDWGLALLNPGLAAGTNPSTVTSPAAAAGSNDAAQLRQHGSDQLRVVVQQLQVLLPKETVASHTAAAGAAPAAYTSCVAAAPSAGTAAYSPADDILASLTCLEQLTAGLSAADDAGATRASSDSAAAGSTADQGTGIGEQLCSHTLMLQG